MYTVNVASLRGFAAIALMLSFARRSGLYKFGKNSEQGRRMVRKKTLKGYESIIIT